MSATIAGGRPPDQRQAASTAFGLDSGLEIAGPIALGVAGAFSGYCLLAEWSAARHGVHTLALRGIGPFPTIGPVSYVAWLIAVIGRAVLSMTLSRWLICVASALTAAIVPWCALTQVTRPPLTLLVPLLLFGLVALAGSAHRATPVERTCVVVGSAATATALTVSGFRHLPGPLGYLVDRLDHREWSLMLGYPSPAVLTLIAVGLLAVLITLAATGAVLVRLRGDGRALWAAAILLVPGAPWTTPLLAGASPETAIMVAGTATAGTFLAVVGWLAHQCDASVDRHRPAESGLYLTAVVASGFAVAVAAYTWASPASGTEPYSLVRLVALGLLTLVGGLTHRPRPATAARQVTHLAAATAFGLAVCLAFAVSFGLAEYPYESPATGLPDLADAYLGDGYTAPLAVALAPTVVCAIGLAAAWQALRGPLNLLWLRGAAVLLISGGWLAAILSTPAT